MTSAIIEFEGFQLHPYIFIVKELSFYAVENGYHSRWTFLPPCHWDSLPPQKRKSYAWFIQNGHLLSWNSGKLPYTSLRVILTSLFASYTTLYTKGPEKAKFLQKLSGRPILDLNQLGCPNVLCWDRVYVRCPDHTPDFRHCALAKATAYGSFIKEKQAKSEVILTQHVDRGASQTSQQM